MQNGWLFTVEFSDCTGFWYFAAAAREKREFPRGNGTMSLAVEQQEQIPTMENTSSGIPFMKPTPILILCALLFLSVPAAAAEVLTSGISSAAATTENPPYDVSVYIRDSR